MSQLKITNAGIAYKNEVFVGTESLNITKMVFAHVPGINADSPILSDSVPANIVHNQPIERVSNLDGDAVVISAVLGYDVGDFTFNWFGAIAEKADGSEELIAIVHTNEQTKTRTNGPKVGDYSVKTIVWRSQQIADNLNVELPTLPWQVNDGVFATTASLNEVRELINSAGVGNRIDYSSDNFIIRSFDITIDAGARVPFPDLPDNACDILVYGLTDGTGTVTTFVGRFAKYGSTWSANHIYGATDGSNHPSIEIVNNIPHFKNNHSTNRYPFSFYCHIAAQDSKNAKPFEFFQNVYSPYNKPTPEALGVAPAVGRNITTGSLNDLCEKSEVVLASSSVSDKPLNDKAFIVEVNVIEFSGGKRVIQTAHEYQTLKRSYVRYRSVEGTWSQWDAFYTENNKPSQVDVGLDKVRNVDSFDYLPVHSQRDFTDGTLIKTSINYAVSSGHSWMLEIKGNGYQGGLPIDVRAQGYIYGGTIIQREGIATGFKLTGLIAVNLGGNLCFWFPRQAYWQGFEVRCISTQHAGYRENCVTSISNSTKPVGTKEASIPLAYVFDSTQKPTPADIHAKLDRLVKSQIDSNAGQDLLIRQKRALVGAPDELVINYQSDWARVSAAGKWNFLGDVEIKYDLKMVGDDSYIWTPNKAGGKTGLYDPHIKKTVFTYVNGGSLDFKTDLNVIKNNPWFTLNSSGSGSTNVEQAAGVSVGESGRGGASVHMTYIGDGNSYIGMGDVGSDSKPDNWAMQMNYQQTWVRFRSEIQIGNGSTKLTKGYNNALRINTPHGNLDLGAQTANHCHFKTSSPSFYFDKPVIIKDGATIDGTHQVIHSGSISEYLRVGYRSSAGNGSLSLGENRLIESKRYTLPKVSSLPRSSKVEVTKEIDIAATLATEDSKIWYVNSRREKNELTEFEFSDHRKLTFYLNGNKEWELSSE